MIVFLKKLKNGMMKSLGKKRLEDIAKNLKMPKCD